MRTALSSFSKLSRPIAGLCAAIMLAAVPPAVAGDFDARLLGDYGNVTVMEVSGTYDANRPDGSINAVPRQTIAREFFRTHKDEYDFVVVFTTFDFRMPEAEADGFYLHVKNDTQGIGKQQYDNSALFGSSGRLQGMIDMGNLDGKASSPLDPGFEKTLNVLSHEMLHRWSAYVHFVDSTGATSGALLGKDGAHWSYLLDTKGSLQYGGQWQDNGNGTFTVVAARTYYSPLDLYLMGMIDKSKVPPMLLIDNPAIDPNKIPSVGTTISGTARYVTIDDIIAAEGERVPAAQNAPKQFKVAFVLAVAPGTFWGDELYGLENIRNGFLTRYSILTDGKGLVQVTSTPKDDLPVNPGTRPPVVPPRTLPPNISDGVSWLVNRQQSDGSWTDFVLTTERDTAESVSTLQQFPSAAIPFQAGFAWLATNASANTDFLARRIESIVKAGGDAGALVQELLSRVNPDGGWGSGSNYVSSPSDTARALNALAAAGYGGSQVIGRAIAYLQTVQNGDGGWSGGDATSTIQPTAAVLTAFNGYRNAVPLDDRITRAVACLAGKQNPDGGFGNSPSTVYDSALAVMALQASNADRGMIGRGVVWLQGQQAEDGSWYASPYQTALAVRAIWQADLEPDLSVAAEDISIIPEKVTVLPTTAVMNVTVRNLGRNDVPQATVALYDGEVTPEKKIGEQTAAFPGLSPVTLTFAIPVTDAKGHGYIVVVDPDRLIRETNIANNRGSKGLFPELSYDFLVTDSDISVTPRVADRGKDVSISVKISNRGVTDGSSVPVRFFVDLPGAPLEIARGSFDIPAGSSITKVVTWKASIPGTDMPITVQIDPDKIFTEISTDNNTAKALLTVNASSLPNLSVSYKDMVITPSPAREGGNASISVQVRNDGYSTAENVKVSMFNGVEESGGTLLGSRTIPAIAAGQSEMITFDWAGIAVSGTQLITVKVDPDNSLSEVTKDDNFTFTNLDVLSLPDLAVSTSSIVVSPGTPRAGDPVSIAVTVQNGGEQEARDVVVLAKEGNVVIGSTILPVVNGNSQATGSVSYPNTDRRGTHQVTVAVDPDGLIPEHYRENNSALKAFSIQDANLWLTETYTSPNGDGIKDTTDFSFRLATPTQVQVRVVNANDVAVRTLSGGELNDTAGATVTWDGTNDDGSLVADGTYRIKVVAANGAVLASLPVEVDTNRSTLADAIHEGALLQNNVTCQLPASIYEWGWQSYDSGMLFNNQYSCPNLPAGLYQMTPTGEDLHRIIPDDWSDDRYDYSVDKASGVWNSTGTKFAFEVWKRDKLSNKQQGTIWEQSVDGSGRRELAGGMDLGIGRLKWSPDSKRLSFPYGPVHYQGYDAAYELRVVDSDTGSMTVVDAGYPYWDTDGVAWSPDGNSIAYSVTQYCDAARTYCYQDYESLKVADIGGETRLLYAAADMYSFKKIIWLADRMLLVQEPWRLVLTDATEPKPPIVVQDLAEFASSSPHQAVFAVSPDRRSVAFVSQQGDSDRVNRTVKISDLTGTIVTIGDMGDQSLRLDEVGMRVDDAVNPIWSPDGSKLAYVRSEFRDTDRKNHENLVVYDTAGATSTTYPIATADIPVFNNFTGGGAFRSVNGLAAWLSDKVSILVESINGYFTVNSGNGSTSGYLPIQDGWDVGVSPDQRYIAYLQDVSPVGACAKQGGEDIWTLSSLLNLTADIRITKNRSVVKLAGIAADRNFAGYKLEYADSAAPDNWNLIMPPSDVPVIHDAFIDWVPPKEGTYLVRLTVWDKAGNTVVERRSVAWGISTLVTGMFRDNEFIAPKNPDNPKQTVTFHYTVLDAVHLEFAIVNDKGETVRTFLREHAGYAVDYIVWDGRDEGGVLVPDGKYTIRLFDYAFPVEVDNTLPNVRIGLSSITYDSTSKSYYVAVGASATDGRMRKWTIQSGTGDNPQEWYELDSGTSDKPDYVRMYIDEQIAALKQVHFRIVAEDLAGNRSIATSGLTDQRVVFNKICTVENGLPKCTVLPPSETPLPESFTRGTSYYLGGFETIPTETQNVTLQFSDGSTWSDMQEQHQGGAIRFEWVQPDTVTRPYALRFKVVTRNGLSYYSGVITANESFEADYPCEGGPAAYNNLFEALRGLEAKVTSPDGRSETHIFDPVPTGRFNLQVPFNSDGTLFDQYDILLKGTGISGKVYSYHSLLRKPVTCNGGTGLPPTPPGLPPTGSTGGGGTAVPFDVIYSEAQACGNNSGEILLPTERLSLAQASKVDYLVKVGDSRRVIGEVNIAVEGPRRVAVDTSVLPEGTYPLSVVITGNDNSQLQSDLGKAVVVDREAPRAQLVSPSSPCPLKVVSLRGNRTGVGIHGSVSDNNKVSRYALFYGVGENPLAWTAAMSAEGDGTRQISGDKAVSGLLGTLDITGLPGSVFTIRLEVVDGAGNKGCATEVIRVDKEIAVTSYSVSPALFSPNDDGVMDALSASFGIDEPAILDLSVYRLVNTNGGEIVGGVQRHILTGLNFSGGAATYGWDGKGDLGTYLTDSRYEVALSATDACGNTTTQKQVVELDNTPPLISLEYPLHGSTLDSGSITEVKGSASDLHFKSWILEVGEGDSPSSWNVIATANRPVAHGVLAVWNSGGLKGLWSLRFSAEDAAGNKKVASSVINLGGRPGFIKNFNVLPKLISPNGDNKADASLITFEVADSSSITIDVSDSESKPVKRFVTSVPAAGTGSVVWDGRNMSGITVPDGTYTCRLIASSATQPEVSQTETLTLAVDATPPSVAVNDPPDKAYLNGTDITVSGTINDPNLADYRVVISGPHGVKELDSGVQDRSSYVFGRISDLSEDDYRVTVEAGDQGENRSKFVRDFTIDRTPPKVTLDAPKNASYYGNAQNVITIAGAIIEKNLAHYSVRYGMGEAPVVWKEVAGGDMLPASGMLASLQVGKTDSVDDGIYTLSLYGKDKAGLEGESRVRLVVDNTSPSIGFSGLPAGSFLTVGAVLKGTVSDPNLDKGVLELSEGRCETASRWGALTSVANPITDGILATLKVMPVDGDYCLRLSASDKSGNKAETKVDVKIDTLPPAAPALSGLTQNAADSHLAWSGNSEADLAGYNLYRDGKRLNSAVLTAVTYVDTNLPEGSYAYAVKAVDRAGNESDASNIVRLRIDKTGPTVRLVSPVNGARVTGLVDIRGTAFSEDDFKEYRVYAGQGENPSSWNLLHRSTIPTSFGQLGQLDTLGQVEGGGISIKLESEDVSGNVTTHQTTVTVDNTAPKTPVLLTAVANGSSVTVTWNANEASSPEPDLAGYLLYRDDQIANSPSAVVGSLTPYLIKSTSYVDASRQDGTFRYHLVAMDQAGNPSAESNALGVTVDTHPPHVTIVEPGWYARFESAFSIKGESPDTDITSVQFQYRLNGTVPWINAGAPVLTAPFVTSLDPKALQLAYGTYSLRAVATDKGGKTDPSPQEKYIYISDLTPPPPPVGLTAVEKGEDVVLTWDAPANTPDLQGYTVYLLYGWGGVNIGNVTETTFTHKSPGNGTYEYYVVANDIYWNESAPSNHVKKTVFAPLLDQPFTPTAETSLTLTGSSAASDATLQVFLEKSGVIASVGTVAADPQGNFSLEISGLTLGENVLTAVATDAAGNVSRTSDRVMVMVNDTPSVPTGLSGSAEGDVVNLTWGLNPEADMAGYKVYRDGVDLLPSQSIDPIWAYAGTVDTDDPLSNPSHLVDFDLSTYWSSERGNGVFIPQYLNVNFYQTLVDSLDIVWGTRVDADGTSTLLAGKDFEIRAWGGTGWVTLKKVRGNASETNHFTFEPAYPTGAITIFISGTTDPADSRQVRVNDLYLTRKMMTASPAYSSSGLSNGSYGFQVQAVDRYGFASARTDVMTVSVVDVLPRAIPDNLTADVNLSDVTLAWSLPARADSDVAGCNVYRNNGAGWLKINGDAVTGNSYLDAKLRNGTYRYRITAVDTTGNESEPSNEVPAVVEIEPPRSVPVNLQVSTLPEGRRLSVAWEEADGAATACNVYRGTVAGGPYARANRSPIQGRSFLDENLIDGTRYYYVVVDVDQSGNEGPKSNEASGIPVDLVAPARPAITGPTAPGIPVVVHDNATTIAGKTDPGTAVDLYRNGIFWGTASASRGLAIESKTLQHPVYWASLSPDGTLLAYVDDNDYYVWVQNLITGELTNVTMEEGDTLQWSPDGKKLAYTYWEMNEGYRIAVYDRETGTSFPLTDDQDVYEDNPSWTPDGTVLFASTRGGTEEAWTKDLATGVLTQLTSDTNLSWALLSPDGTRICYRGENWISLFVLDVESGKSSSVTDHVYGGEIVWSPDGGKLAYSIIDQDYVRHIDLFDVATGKIEQLSTVVEPSSQYAWASDGNRLVYGYFDWDVSKASIRMVDMNGGDVLLQDGFERLPNIWSSSGMLLYTDDTTLYRTDFMSPFTIPGVDLVPGENRFFAVARDDADNASVRSEEIVVGYDSSTVPDLVVTSDDIGIYPSFPKPGEQVTVNVSIRNTSKTGIDNVAVDLYLWDAVGELRHLESVAIPRIGAERAETVATRVNAGTLSGAQSIIVVVDPDDHMPELFEDNNYASKEFFVTETASLVVDTVLNANEFVSNQDVHVGTTLRNSGRDVSGRLEVRVEGEAGGLVATIASRQIVLAAGESKQDSYSWNTAGIFAGTYRVHTVVKGVDGVLAESIAPFVILPDEMVHATIVTDKMSYGASENVILTSALNNRGINYIIPMLSLRTTISDPRNIVLFTEDKPVRNLMPSATASLMQSWNTGLSSPGEYHVTLDAYLGSTIVASASSRFTVGAATSVSGTLSADPSQVVYGSSLKATFTVENRGNQDADGILRLLVVDPVSLQAVSTTEQAAVIAVNGVQSGQFSIPTQGLDLKAYQLKLYYASSGIQSLLASMPCTVRDGIPPAVTIVQPADGTTYADAVPLAVRAGDDTSGIASVEYRFDAGEWHPLPPVDPTSGNYAYVLESSVVANGQHTVYYRATDHAGNVSEPLGRNFTFKHDTASPVLSVSTLSDGSSTNNEVLNISGTVTDDTGIKEVRINGEVVPVDADGSFSHALVLTGGPNTITVTATDQAGNPASDVRRITLDQTAPSLIVNAPADNSKTASALATVTGTVDESSTVIVKQGTAVQTAVMEGTSFHADLTFVPGINTIEVTATDLAGNTGTQKRTVIYDDQAPSLAVTDPNQDIRTNRGNVTVRGTVSDPYTTVVVFLAVDGQMFTPTVVDGVFEQAVTLTDEKGYAVVVTATNEVGATAVVQRNIMYDTTSPVLGIDPVTSPTDQDSQTVSGTREADAPVTVTCPPAAAGMVEYPTSTTWRILLTSLSLGENVVTATSTDAAGNVATVTAHITFAASSVAPLFDFALFGNAGVSLSGGSYTDSYRGSAGSHVRGQYVNGNVGTNSQLLCGIKLTGGTWVYGETLGGFGGSAATEVCTTGGSYVHNNVIGTLASRKDMTPMVDPGGGTPLGALKLTGGARKTITAGNYRYASLDLAGGSGLTLDGPITLHVDGNFKVAGGASITVTSGPVVVYQNGQKLDISNGVMVNNSQNPGMLTIYGTAGLQTVNLAGGTNLHFLLYAPTAAVKISGGQNTFGSIVGNTIDLSGGSSVHYPEQLLK